MSWRYREIAMFLHQGSGRNTDWTDFRFQFRTFILNGLTTGLGNPGSTLTNKGKVKRDANNCFSPSDLVGQRKWNRHVHWLSSEHNLRWRHGSVLCGRSAFRPGFVFVTQWRSSVVSFFQNFVFHEIWKKRDFQDSGTKGIVAGLSRNLRDSWQLWKYTLSFHCKKKI